jgi:hypothetical protein
MGSRLFIDLTSTGRNTMGLGLFFELVSPGDPRGCSREKIGSASALSGYPLGFANGGSKHLRRAKQRRRHLGGGLASRLVSSRVVVDPHTAVDTWGFTFPAVVRHDPGVSAVGLVVPEGGEGPCRYVVGLVGPYDVRRCVASWGYPSERRTSSSGDVLVEILVVVVEVAGRLGDPGAAADGSVVRTVGARGPASASREGPAPRFVASRVELLVVVVGPIVLAAVALGPARAIWDGRTRRFLARSIEQAFLGATAVGPLVYDGATLESIVVVVVLVELLLLRVEIARSRVLLGDGGGLRHPGGHLLGAAAFGHAAGLGPIVRIALGVALGVLESDGLRPAALGGRLRPVKTKQEGLLAAKLLPGRRAARLLPRGPACRLRFRHAAVDLGPAGGISTSRDGPEVV